MSRKGKRKISNFLVQYGYLFVFTLISAFALLSYFWANDYFIKSHSKEVLGSSSIRGLWVRADSDDSCSEASIINASGCIKDDYFSDYEVLNSQKISLDGTGKFVFSNDYLFMSGIFYMKEFINNDVWSNLQIGDLSLKINDRQWVFEDVVWSKEDINSLMEIVRIDGNYLILLHPSVTLTGQNRQFWAFEYFMSSDTVSTVFFDRDGKRSFVESTYGEILEKDSELYLKLERYDPSLMGSSEVVLYEFDKDFVFLNNFVLKKG
jgi:hypothetical protein